MKKKILALILAFALMLCCFSGCALVQTDSEKDMAQSVAEVDISESEDFQEGGEFYEYRDVIRPMSITKRELVAYFVNSGYSYITSGQSYADTFETLMDSLVNYRIILQYSMVYFFEASKDAGSAYYGMYSVEGYNAFVSGATDEELTLKTLQYFLDDEEADEVCTIEGTVYTRYDAAEYALKQSINSAIDSQEAYYIVAQDDTSSTDTTEEEDRAVPDGAQTAGEDYIDPDYDVYTGRNALTACGSYEKVEGGTVNTRLKGYNGFLQMLSDNNLLTKEEMSTASSTEEGKGIAATSYYRSELVTQLQSALSEKLSDSFENEAAGKITASYLKQAYAETFASQEAIYNADRSTFETNLDSVSDSSFVLYAPEDDDAVDQSKYGFVYNILLPFSTEQSYKLKEYSNDSGLTETEKYQKRAELLEEIEGTDQRASWFNGATDYSFNATAKGMTKGTDYYDNGNNSNHLFFEDSILKSDGDNAAYEKIQKYYGRYPYNGTVSYDAKAGSYKLTPNKLNITSFLTEMENYMNWALDRDGFDTVTAAGVNGTVSYNGVDFSATAGKVSGYMQGDLRGDDGKIDYSKFVYYIGQVGGLTFSPNNALAEGNAAYTALSAFNELQFAYSTDSGVLNTYLGYTILRYDTEFVKEYEYAAKLAVKEGVGTYVVCPSDYGWHIIYCTFAFDGGAVYGTEIDWTPFVGESGVIDEDKLTENTFEYFYYQALKDSITSSYENVLQTKIVNVYNVDACVTIHEERYSDYTSLENNYSSSSSSSTTTVQ